jgi:hypothetical protein
MVLVCTCIEHFAGPVLGLQHQEATAIHLVFANGPLKVVALIHANLDQIRPISYPDGVRSQHRALGLDFRADCIFGLAPAWLCQQKLLLDLLAGFPCYGFLPAKCYARHPWYFGRLAMMGWDWHLRTVASVGLLFIPGWFAMWTMVWWYWLRVTHNLSSRVLWQPPVLSVSSVSRSSGCPQYWLMVLSKHQGQLSPICLHGSVLSKHQGQLSPVCMAQCLVSTRAPLSSAINCGHC